MPPMHWPHPTAGVLALIGLWVAGMLLAVLVPAVLVPPGEAAAAPGGEVALAFGCTVLGALVMAAVGMLLYRRTHQPLAWAFGAVPAVTVVIGGAIIAATAGFAS
ncbi:hypothetical protein GCM10027194_26100 [Thalassiella azotivora]